MSLRKLYLKLEINSKQLKIKLKRELTLLRFMEIKAELELVSQQIRVDCDVQIRDLLKQSEDAVMGLEMSLTPMRKKFAGMGPEEQEEFKQKEKLVELIQDQLQANKSSFENEEYVPRRRADPNNGLAVKKMGSIFSN